MANKRINDLQARSSADATINIAVDDASQSWRVTGAQMLAYIAANVTALASWITGQSADTAPASDDYLLTYDTSATSLKKVTKADFKKQVRRAITTTDTATAADDLISCDASGGGYTLNLPTAASITGKVYTIKKTDSSTNAITVDANSTETIDGVLTRKLATQYDFIQVMSDGTNWIVLNERIPIVSVYTLSANSAPGIGNPLNFNTAVSDPHGAVTTGAAWKFTAPVARNYRVSLQAAFGSTAGWLCLYKNGTVYRDAAYIGTGSGQGYFGTSDFVVPLAAGDYIDFRPISNTTYAGGTGGSGSAQCTGVAVSSV